MEVKIIKEDKSMLDLELPTVTLAELLRVYLNKEDVKLAVWKRDHPTKKPVLHIEDDNPKKALKNAIAKLEKEIDKTVDDFKKLK